VKGEIVVKDQHSDHSGQVFIKWIASETSTNLKNLQVTNLALAASVTACARVRLYNELGKLGDRAIYCDTDSIIYEHRPNEYNVKQGIFLGEWTCETDGKAIVDFVGASAKSYSYVCEGEEESEAHTKMKGLTLNYANKQVVNHASMIKMVETDCSLTTGVGVNSNMRFSMKKDTGTMVTTHIQKSFKQTASEKRHFITHDQSVPFGYAL